MSLPAALALIVGTWVVAFALVPFVPHERHGDMTSDTEALLWMLVITGIGCSGAIIAVASS